MIISSNAAPLNNEFNPPSIIEQITTTPTTELKHYWGTNVTDETKVITWIDLIAEHSKKIADAKHLNIKEMIIELLINHPNI